MTQKQLLNRSNLKTFRLSNSVILSFKAAYLKIILSIFLCGSAIRSIQRPVSLVKLVCGDNEVLWWVDTDLR